MAVLKGRSLIVEANETAHALAFGFSILVRIFDLLVSVVHVTRANRLHIFVEGTTQNSFDVLDIHTLTTVRRMNLTFITCETVNKILVQLVTV